jgi:NAD(P)-dependent dehydrogenase (short-subunit alcohol dehydrogenase family)
LSKNIVICGGSGLIGSTIVDNLIKENFNVVNIDLKKKKNVQTIIFELNDQKQFPLLKKKIKIFSKKIDVFINCSYPKKNMQKKKFHQISLKDFKEELSGNMNNFLIYNQFFLKIFLRQKHGKILNFSSIYSNFIPRFEIYDNTKMTMPLSYQISKNAINISSKYLAKFYKKKNITFNTISPGGVMSKQSKEFVKNYSKFTNSKRGLIKASEIFGLVKFLISDESNKITGQDFIIDDGFTL